MSDCKFEILSPAGSFDTLVCAVNNGADAVYIGGQSFSARKNAVNFSNEEILSAVRYAHLHNAKVYVTLNTLVADSELKEAYDFTAFCYRAGVDALIIQDLGILHMVRSYFPDFEIHASTQMTVHNAAGARLAKEMGFKRVVLSRELSFEEIKKISRSVDIELEVFVHGALCMSYSGQCLMSSFLGARSGNRGACAQPCRLPYTLLDKAGKDVSGRDKYLLSLKDLCLVDEIDTLRECKVTSLKIEGRMKSSDYVSIVTSIYNKYRNGGKVSGEDLSILKNIFSRSGFTKGYLNADTGRHMLNYNQNNDKVYSNISESVKSLADELKSITPPKIPFTAKACVSMAKPMELTACAMGKTVNVTGSIPAQEAVSVPLTQERIISQLAKTGATEFELGDAAITLDEGVSLPVKEINELRRSALSMLTDAVCLPERLGVNGQFQPCIGSAGFDGKVSFNAEVMTLEQAHAAAMAGFDKLLVPYSLYEKHKAELDGLPALAAVILPPIVRDINPVDDDILPCEVYASNISQINYASGHTVTADFRINTFNSYAVKLLKEQGVHSVCLSPELNLRQIHLLTSSLPTELIVYGRIPLMTVQNCVVKSAHGRCSCTDDMYYLRDRKGVKFPVFTHKGSCTNTIYNSAPVYMADRLSELPREGICAYRFIFTTETPDHIESIIFNYKNSLKYDGDFTRGHYYRGV